MRRTLIFSLVAGLLAACSDSNPGPDETNGTQPAVMVVAQVVTPDDYLTYVAAFPDVPEGEVSLAGFREFGNANVYTNAGYVYVEQDGAVTRFSVKDDFTLIENAARFSWADFGIPSANASYTVFVSATRAYTFAPEIDLIVVWDPQTMTRTSLIEVDFPERAGMETWAFDGHHVGDKVIWNVFSGNFDTPEPYPAITLVVADANSDAEPQIIEDDRCLPGGPSFVDESGDYYVHGGAYFGYFYAYGDLADDARTCILRMRAGEDTLDDAYVVEYEELLGSPVSDPWYHVTGDQYVVRSWDPEVAYPEDSDLFWDNEALRPLLVDVSEGTVEPYPDLDDKVGIDGVVREVDGVSYYQISDTGYVAGGDAEIVQLRVDGIEPQFHLDGFLLGLARIR